MQNAQLQTRNDSQEKPYRWPQKVHRYGLMQHPFLRLFVGLYENKIPWNSRPQGWCAESLRAYIRAEMLPSLKPVPPKNSAGTAFGDAFYLRRINLDAALHDAGNSYLRSLRRERLQNPQSVEQKAIGHFNRQKHAVFRDWWRVMNEHYGEYPEWIYCLLRRIFAMSDRDSRAQAPRMRLTTVKKLTTAVVQGDISPSVGLSSVYLLMDAGMDTVGSREDETGWIRVAIDDPRSSHNEKLQLLSYFGRRARWCIAYPGTADRYLSRSDFYVLCVAGSPKVAIRCGNRSSGESSSLRVEEVTQTPCHSLSIKVAVELLIAVLKGTTHIPEGERLGPGSNLSCLDFDGWKRVLEVVPFALHLAPKAVRSSKCIRQMAYAANLRYILRDPFWIPYARWETTGFESLTADMEATLASALRSMAIPVRNLGRSLLRHPKLLSAWEHGWIRHLEQKATTIDVPRRILALPELRPLAVQAFRMDLTRAGVPPQLQSFYGEDPGLIEEYRQAWVRYLRQTKNPTAEVPRRFAHDKQIASAWSAAHMNNAKRGIAPPKCHPVGMLRGAWCGLWIVALKAIFAEPAYTTYDINVPRELLNNPVIKSLLREGRMACLQKYLGNREWLALFLPKFLQQIRERSRSSGAEREFMLEYLRMAARFNAFPFFDTLSAEEETDPLKRSLLNEFAKDSEFQELWLKGWQEAAVARLRWQPIACKMGGFRVPQVVTALPEVRSAAVKSCIAYVQKAAASKNPAHKPAIADPVPPGTLASADMETYPAIGCFRGNSAGCAPVADPAAGSATAEKRQRAVLKQAATTAAAFFESLAFHGQVLGIEIPPKDIAEDPVLSRQWSQQWPQQVADLIPVENFSNARECAELDIPAVVWEQPAGRQVLRELVLRFLASRGPGHPLERNDTLPKPFAHDAQMQEVWITTWERLLREMPQEYAAYRRVAPSLQHLPRVFWTWLQAVRPLNRLHEEEEAWRDFFLLNSVDSFPPFLPRPEILERNAKLRSTVRKLLQKNGMPFPGQGLTGGWRSAPELPGSAQNPQSPHPARLTVDFELFHEAFRVACCGPEQTARTASPLGAKAHLIRACDSLRAAPWQLESLPPEHAQNPFFRESALSGWHSYLIAAPWLLPFLPKSQRSRFQRTRNGIEITPRPPQPPPANAMHAAA